MFEETAIMEMHITVSFMREYVTVISGHFTNMD